MGTVIQGPSGAKSFSREQTEAPSEKRSIWTKGSSNDDVFEKTHLARPQSVRILEPESEEMQSVRDMIESKALSWNDAETRALLVRAGWSSKLVEAMHLLPDSQKAQAREDLAKSAVAYFEENGGLECDLANEFLRAHRDLFLTLFAKDCALRLAPPEGYQAQISNAVTMAQCFDIFVRIPALRNSDD